MIHMSNTDNTINITVARQTHKKLCSNGSKGETFDQIINKLIDFWNEQHKGGD